MASDGQMKAWRADFEEKGPQKVREELARDLYGIPSDHKVKLAQAFLTECEAEGERNFREGESARGSKALELAEEANEIAREARSAAVEANQIAESARTWVRWTALVAGFVFVMQSIQWWLMRPS